MSPRATPFPTERSAVVEVYPALWSRSFAKEGRASDQHKAFTIVLPRADRDGSLAIFLNPELTPPERATALVKGWILGVPWARARRPPPLQDFFAAPLSAEIIFLLLYRQAPEPHAFSARVCVRSFVAPGLVG